MPGTKSYDTFMLTKELVSGLVNKTCLYKNHACTVFFQSYRYENVTHTHAEQVFHERADSGRRQIDLFTGLSFSLWLRLISTECRTHTGNWGAGSGGQAPERLWVHGRRAWTGPARRAGFGRSLSPGRRNPVTLSPSLGRRAPRKTPMLGSTSQTPL